MFPDSKHELRARCRANAKALPRATDKRRVDVWQLFLECDATPYPVSPSEPSDFVYDVNGNITVIGESKSREVAGRFEIAYLDVEQAANESISCFDVFDSHQYTSEFYDAIVASGEVEINPRLLKLLGHDHLYVANVLILKRLELLAKFRGDAIGLLTMRGLIQRFSAGASVVAIKPFPLQFESGPPERDAEWVVQLSLDDFPGDARTATMRLRRYYAHLGFRKLPGTPFMFLSTAQCLVSVDELSSPGQ